MTEAHAGIEPASPPQSLTVGVKVRADTAIDGIHSAHEHTGAQKQPPHRAQITSEIDVNACTVSGCADRVTLPVNEGKNYQWNSTDQEDRPSEGKQDKQEAPTSAVPVSAVPVSAVPVSAVPVSAVPVSTVPVSVVPVSAGSATVQPVIAVRPRRDVVYNEIPAYSPIGIAVSDNTRRRGLMSFSIIQGAPQFNRKHESAKLEWWCRLLTASALALYRSGCVRVSRRNGVSQKLWQVVDCAVECGLFKPYPSPPGAPKESRYLPTSLMRALVSLDFKDFNVEPTTFVELYTRRDKRQGIEPVPLPFDMTGTPADIQCRLTKINASNNSWYMSAIRKTKRADAELILVDPTLTAKFTEVPNTELWTRHGRLYSGACGHQSLRKKERGSIVFAATASAAMARIGEPGVELDYGSFHTRILYHLRGLPAPEDCYAVKGKRTGKALRELAKLVLNASINAKTLGGAIASCNAVANEYDFWRKAWKQGDDLLEAREQKRALKRAKTTFKEVQKLLLAMHAPIADQLCSDAGLYLMHLDSQIALDVLEHFADLSVPCLGVHDSFVVPAPYETELLKAMVEAYRRHVNSNASPIIKKAAA